MGSDWHEVQRRFYDSTADEYRENFQQANPYHAFVIEHFLDAIGPRPGERVLELGTSGGRFTVPLLEHGCRVTGVDISAKSIQYLQHLMESHPRRSDLKLVEDDASSLSRLDDRDFDAVVGAHILHHVLDVRKVLEHALDRLRRGGRVVFLEPNPWNPQWYAHIALHPGKSWRVERGMLRVWPGRVRKAFLQAGFGNCTVTTFGCFPPFMLNIMPVSRSLEAALERCGPLARAFTLNLFVGRKA